MLALEKSEAQPWLNPQGFWPSLNTATAGLATPFGVISVPALAWNAYDMLARASGKPIRVATKSVRVRGAIDAVLALPGYSGVLAFTLAEGLWLAETIDDVVIGYPSVNRAALAELAGSPKLASRVAIMIDSVDQLDFVDAVVSAQKRENIRVVIDLDASWQSKALGYTGVYRSPVRTPEHATVLARQVIDRAGFTLVGIMSYEAQIAGVANRPVGRPLRGRLLDWMQRSSYSELTERRGAVVAAVRELTDLEFVNGGGTGSLELTAADPSITEIAAGSGLFGPHLFDGYGHFQPAPAAAFALSVVRKPTPAMATLHGGGWIASGPPTRDRMPQLAWPEGLKYVAREAAGEVQSPVRGRGASALSVGDRVWLRHTKAGELSEHLNEFALVDGDRIVDTMKTYRGEGKAFL
jgi:D-serine deaminase-like pyridoxal phosphate-dependent protein